MSHNLI